jgi:hypothetical protein
VQQERPSKVQRNARHLAIARKEGERNATPLENRGKGKTQGIPELHIEQGTVERPLLRQPAGFFQLTDRADRLQAPVTQVVGDDFPEQGAVFGNEYGRQASDPKYPSTQRGVRDNVAGAARKIMTGGAEIRRERRE